MKKITIVLVLLGLLRVEAGAQTPVPAAFEKYPVDSASVEHPGVPKGELVKCSFDHSAVFPGTHRDYWIYIPAQYKPDHPACVYVNQDGIQWKAPTVFDNLINSGDMPVTIGVFVTPGRVGASDTATALDRYNRSFEYDGLGDAYVRFLLTELLPDVEKHRAGDGRAIHLSQKGSDRAIGGSSSGAIAAFTVAWERPDAFTRVFSAIGTYVGLRGGDRYPILIRKTEPKPIRVFLEDGSGDLNIYGGDWWMANQTMERALTFGGYEVKHVYGEGGHNGTLGSAIFPDVMRWLWKGWPQAIAKGSSANGVLHDILIPRQDWELVGEGYGFTEGTAADGEGNVYFQDIPASKTYRVSASGGQPEVVSVDAQRASGTCFGVDGSRYEVAGGSRQVLRYKASGKGGERDAGNGAERDAGKAAVIADNISGNDLVVARNGNVYVTAPDGAERPGKLYLVRPGGQPVIVDSGLKFINGLCFTPDQSQLYVAESAGHWIWVYTILPDGMLGNKQRFGWLHVPDDKDNAWPDGLKCDRNGLVYVATNMGIQVLDPLGRVNAILPVPSGQPSNCCFGGTNFDVLYVSSGGKVYRRKLKTRGCNPFEAGNRPGVPRL